MYPSLLLGFWNALNPVYPRFVLEQTICTFTFHTCNHFLVATRCSFGDIHHDELITSSFTESLIHPPKVARKNSGLIPTGAGPDFKNRILLVIRILGHQ